MPVILLWLLVDAHLSFAAGAESEKWQILKTKHLALHYLTIGDLSGLDDAIDYSHESDRFSGFFSSKKTGMEIENSLAKKVDALFEKVQLILDMRKSRDRVRVNIYPDETALHNAYFSIYKKKRNLRGWYIYEYNTIYVNIKDLNEHILAHEMAHAIIDNFMSIRPPRATAEILAR